ncbi:hypothetical protein E8L99_16165 [Phreatobacter aquaticus]|uniref:VCBS repeat-containing protein n=1 Tax=Phreatobacter aquaticus TaxID=2570229 RepID=A0A4D7QMH8_9HYPH|nr:hypothetical protein [Phreatobacter aquaticus]QCK87183.1 hypothetical protein E8L99_16165 [Phreatobacter aquaticus]
MAQRMEWWMGAVMAATLQIGPAAAQSLPREVEAARRSAGEACIGRVEFAPGYIQMVDFNGDGRPDYLVNEEMVKCPGAPPLFCGSGGCSWALYLSGAGGGYRKVLDGLDYKLTIERSATPPILGTEGRGGRSRYQWNGRAMARIGGR